MIFVDLLDWNQTSSLCAGFLEIRDHLSLDRICLHAKEQKKKTHKTHHKKVVSRVVPPSHDGGWFIANAKLVLSLTYKYLLCAICHFVIVGVLVYLYTHPLIGGDFLRGRRLNGQFRGCETIIRFPILNPLVVCVFRTIKHNPFQQS